MGNSIEVSGMCRDCGLVDYIEVEISLDMDAKSTTAYTFIAEAHNCKKEQQSGESSGEPPASQGASHV